jgi:hypothetical protein
MKVRWILIGFLIAVGLFIFFPGLFNFIVSLLQSGIHFVQSFFNTTA